MVINVRKIAFISNFDKNTLNQYVFRVKINIWQEKGVALLCESKHIIKVDDYLGKLSQQWFIVFKTQIHCFKNNIRK